MQVLDYAILVVSGTDGVQAHTETLWRLLRRYQIPTFLFFNKMDLPGADRAALLTQAAQRLSERCLEPQDLESVALCDERALSLYLEQGTLSDAAIADLVRRQVFFPCFFGAALHLTGVGEFLEALRRFTVPPVYPEAFAARVYKITRDPQAGRLTWLKVTGGCLRVRTTVAYTPRGGEPMEEKVIQLRQYSGAGFKPVDEVPAGEVCAVAGLSALRAGDVLGAEPEGIRPLLNPVMTYRLNLPPQCDVRTALPKLRQLEEEEPQLHIAWNEQLRELQLQLMGEVQLEIVKSLISERFGWEVTIDSGRISYRETIAAPVEGVGHFEPLRHYAEVHLLLEPLPLGSGLVFCSTCSEDVLDRNWQRLILTHLKEKTHSGVLTGSPITDMKLTLAAGRAHLKHTEGGDFRQATYRAVRQGLMQARSVLLEPYYRFTLTVPPEQLGRAINDIRAMSGTFGAPRETPGGMQLSGSVPVSEMQGYAAQLAAYSRGQGRLSCLAEGYVPCHNTQQVVAELGYDPLRDPENTPDSVFCAHGAGFTVPWNRVQEYMHLESVLKVPAQVAPAPKLRPRNLDLDEKELQEIMEREFGPDKRSYRPAPPAVRSEEITLPPPKQEYLIVDGYNIIFACDGLREQAQTDLAGARDRLLDLLSNYCGYHPCELVVVFDSYRVKGGAGSRTKERNLRVVYTQEGQSADQYIEALADRIGKNYAVRVATSDALIQLSALRSGILRMSASELLCEVERVNEKIAEVIRGLHEESRRASIRSNPLRCLKQQE